MVKTRQFRKKKYRSRKINRHNRKIYSKKNRKRRVNPRKRKSRKQQGGIFRKYNNLKGCRNFTNTFGLAIYNKQKDGYECCNWLDRSLFGRCYGVRSELGAIAAPLYAPYYLIK